MWGAEIGQLPEFMVKSSYRFSPDPVAVDIIVGFLFR